MYISFKKHDVGFKRQIFAVSLHRLWRVSTIIIKRRFLYYYIMDVRTSILFGICIQPFAFKYFIISCVWRHRFYREEFNYKIPVKVHGIN